MAGSDLILGWLAEGKKLKITAVPHEQFDIFTAESHGMVDVSCEGKTVRISEMELEHLRRTYMMRPLRLRRPSAFGDPHGPLFGPGGER